MRFAVIYYSCINLLLFGVMGLDKSRAKRKQWRIREASIYSMALLGGSIGGFAGMFFFRHKNRKPLFYLVFLAGMLLHGILVYQIFSEIVTPS